MPRFGDYGDDDFGFLLDEFGPGDDYTGSYDDPNGLVDPPFDPNIGSGETFPGDNVTGPGGSPTNPNDPNFDPSIIGSGPGGGPGGSGPGGGAPGGSSWLSSLLKSLGMTSKDGSVDPSGLLALAALFGGGLNQKNATEKASQQMQDAANKANELATGRLDGASAGFKPYMDAGTNALAKMQAFDGGSLAKQFVSQGAPSNLAAQFHAGPVTMGTLARMGK